jgi:hypothetical protein
MRRLAAAAVLGALAAPSPAWAEPPALAASPAASSPAASSPAASSPTASPTPALRDADPSVRLDALERALAAERYAREHPAVRVSGFVQADWIVHDQSSQNEINDSNGTLLNRDRFTLRRGHARIDAEHGIFSGAIEIDANTTNGLQVRPIEAQASVRWPEAPDAQRWPDLVATAGLLRIPFGYEVQELDWVRPFLERANVLQALFPGEFDLGARLRVRYRFLEAAVAVMNGSPIGAKSFPALDPVHQKDVVGRVGIATDLVSGLRIEAGVSGDAGTGFHAGTPTTKNELVWQDMNGDGVVQPNEITVIPGSAATPSQTFARFAVGADARIIVGIPWLGALTVRGEVVSAVNMDRGLEPADPVVTGRDLREVGFSIGATQEITRWAAAGVRFDRYDPDADADEQRGVRLVPVSRAYTTLALMAMARYGPQRLLIEYDINSNPLGLSPDGAPTTLASNALTLRAQVVF